MSQPGIGAMLHYLGGGSEHSPSEYYGRVIAAASLDAELNTIRLAFTDGTAIEIFDDGQSCCESRYITCDDDLGGLVGETLTGIVEKEHKEDEGEYGEVHEMAFVEISTDRDSVTFCTHNEHNGYYGGFGLSIREVSA